MAGCCRACEDCIAAEILPENFGFCHPRPRAFVTSQWSSHACAYTIYRVCVAILLPVWIAMDYWEETSRFYRDHPEIWFIFATDWGFFLLGVSGIVHAAVCVYYFSRTRGHPGRYPRKELPLNESGKMSPGLMVCWFLINISANTAVVITLSYWAYLTALDHAGFLSTPMSKLKHSLNMVYVIVDLFISAVPIRVFHFIYPLLMGVIYTLFNLTYFDNGGVGPDGKPYVYYVMDWQYPVAASLTCAMGLIMSVLAQLLLFVIADFRAWVYRKTMSGPEDTEDTISEMESILSPADTGSYESLAETDTQTPDSPAILTNHNHNHNHNHH